MASPNLFGSVQKWGRAKSWWAIFTVPCLALLVMIESRVDLFPGQHLSDFQTPTPMAATDILAIGFMGGRDRWNDQTRAVRKMALRLRSLRLPGVHVETIENKRRSLAIQLINQAFDGNQDGVLDGRERASVRLILYGQSFGGAAVVKLANQLETMGVPVILTIQIDSVGFNDGTIPLNVASAANLHQQNGWVIRGEREIRPADPSRTRILGNFEFDYSHNPIDISAVPWFKRVFRGAHTMMEYDPRVWDRVEALILGALSVANERE